MTAARRDRRAATLRIPIEGRLPTRAQLDSTARAVDGIVVQLRRRWPALERAVRDGGRGYPTASLTGGAVSGGGSTIQIEDEYGRPDHVPVSPVERIVLAGGSDDAQRLHEELLLAEGLMATLIATWGRIAAIVPAEGKALELAGRGDVGALAPGAGHCAACERWCAGVGNDRLRSGWCDACRKAWQRHVERLHRIASLVEQQQAAEVAVLEAEHADPDVIPLGLARARHRIADLRAQLDEERALDDRGRFAATRRDQAASG